MFWCLLTKKTSEIYCDQLKNKIFLLFPFNKNHLNLSILFKRTNNYLEVILAN